MNAPSNIKAPTITNGVNVTALMETIDAISRQPQIAQFEFRASNRWIDGARNSATIESYSFANEENRHSSPFVYTADEPKVLCGTDQHANPVEYLLSALSMCVTTSIVAHAASRGIKVDAMDSTLAGDLDVRGFLGISKEVRKGFQHIRMHMRAKTSAPAELLRELAAYSPVFDVVSRSVPVELTIETY